ncbi:hypothetical protein AX15_005814 [Amanita polypyramis BW_CC]|nr:hypothetical protein AX15_005814 [Amanita polypyramis BW_CC]
MLTFEKTKGQNYPDPIPSWDIAWKGSSPSQRRRSHCRPFLLCYPGFSLSGLSRSTFITTTCGPGGGTQVRQHNRLNTCHRYEQGRGLRQDNLTKLKYYATHMAPRRTHDFWKDWEGWSVFVASWTSMREDQSPMGAENTPTLGGTTLVGYCIIQ